jgi:hypothetical protein
MYRIKPSRLNRLTGAAGRKGPSAATSLLAAWLGELRHASIKGKHAPTQWL